MADYIDREATIKVIEKHIIEEWYDNDPAIDYNIGLRDAQAFIKEMPSADVKHIVRGRWIISNNGSNRTECPFCKGEGWAWQNFCPNCGADMREAQP